MSAMAGHDGQFKVGTTAVGYIDSFNLTINNGTAETSKLGERFKRFLATVTDWSGSLSGTLDTSDANQKQMLEALCGANAASTQFSVALVVSPDTQLTGMMIVSSVAIGVAHSDKVTVSFNFQGTGPLTSEAIQSGGGEG